MKWHFTPKGVLLALLAIGLLGGAALVNNGILSWLMIILGLITLVSGYIRTAMNIRRIKNGR